MKFIFTTLVLLFFFSTSLFAGRAVLTGNVRNAKVKTATSSYNSGTISYNEVKQTVPVDKKGNFKLVFSVDNYTKIYLSIGEQNTSFYIGPGDSLGLKVDYRSFDSSIVYSGLNSDKNNLHSSMLLNFDYNEAIDVFSENARRDGASFAWFCDSLYTAKIKFIENSAYKPEAAFVTMLNTSLAYDNGLKKLDYPGLWRYLNGKGDTLPDLPWNYYYFTKELSTNDALLLSGYDSFDYIRALMRYHFTNLQASLSQELSLEEKMKVAGVVLKDKAVFDKYYAWFVFNELQSQSFKKAEESYLAYNSRYGKTTYSPELDEIYARVKRIAPGQPAPPFTLMTVEGKPCSLSDFKGKIVYLDFWASWCGPCMGEMPYSKKVREHYEGKDVVFLYVSIDENEKNWKTAIDSKQIKGVHVIAPGFSNNLAKDYNVSGIPTYFLIGRDGRIINNLPPRPSDTEKLTREIDEALKM